MGKQMRAITISGGIAAASALAAVLTACGGGGGTAPSTAIVPVPSSVATMPPNITVVNKSGPTSTLSITITIPQHKTAPTTDVVRRIHTIYGKKTTDAHIRTMANTAATRTVRAAGVTLNKWATAFEKLNGRAPDYVSNATYEMELVVSDGTTTESDGTAQCSVSSSTCTGNFQVPIGSNYTVALYLYDSCNYLLSAGAATGVMVVAGTNQPLLITLNPVVAYLDITTTATSPFVEATDDAQNNFTVTVTPFDADDYTITSPGIPIDETLTTISGVTLATDGTYGDLTGSTSVTLPVTAVAQSPATAYSFPAQTYSFTGTGGSESQIEWSASLNTTGSPLIPGANYPNDHGLNAGNNGTGYLSIPVNLAALTWTNPQGYSSSTAGAPNVQPTTSPGAGMTATNVEFPGPITGSFLFGLSESDPNFTGNITLTDNGGCSGVIASTTPTDQAPTPPPTAYSTLSTYPFVTVQVSASAHSSGCTLIATDDQGRIADLDLFVNQANITVSGKPGARK